jgi:hypothetical protein
MSLKQFVFRRKLKRLKENHDSDKKFMNYNDIRSVLIIFESDMNEKNPEIESILKSLQNDGKKVTACGFVNKKKSDSPTLTHSYMIDHAHVNFFKEPNNDFIKNLLSHKFDIVLDLTLSEVLPLQYILAYANAPFKAGQKMTNFDLLDFMVDLRPDHSTGNNEKQSFIVDVNYLFKQIIFYLKSIESNN